jgi:hypothetical protein
MSKTNETILEKWEVTPEELTELVKNNPSLRGVLLGYVAEMKLRKMWFAGSEVTHATKHDDHDRKKKGDLVVTYKGQEFIIESKSLQTAMNLKVGAKFVGRAQCDASDRRIIPLNDGTTLNTTCLLVGEFDLLAVNVYSFEEVWRFVFAKNQDLPRSKFKKYTDDQRAQLLASLVPVTWPPEPPFYGEPFRLLDEIARDRAAGVLPTPLKLEEVARRPEEAIVRVEADRARTRRTSLPRGTLTKTRK